MRFWAYAKIAGESHERVLAVLEEHLRALSDDIAREGNRITLHGLGPRRVIDRRDTTVFEVSEGFGASIIHADVSCRESLFVPMKKQEEIVRQKLEEVLEQTKAQLEAESELRKEQEAEAAGRAGGEQKALEKGQEEERDRDARWEEAAPVPPEARAHAGGFHLEDYLMSGQMAESRVVTGFDLFDYLTPEAREAAIAAARRAAIAAVVEAALSEASVRSKRSVEGAPRAAPAGAAAGPRLVPREPEAAAPAVEAATAGSVAEPVVEPAVKQVNGPAVESVAEPAVEAAAGPRLVEPAVPLEPARMEAAPVEMAPVAEAPVAEAAGSVDAAVGGVSSGGAAGWGREADSSAALRNDNQTSAAKLAAAREQSVLASVAREQLAVGQAPVRVGRAAWPSAESVAARAESASAPVHEERVEERAPRVMGGEERAEERRRWAAERNAKRLREEDDWTGEAEETAKRSRWAVYGVAAAFLVAALLFGAFDVLKLRKDAEAAQKKEMAAAAAAAAPASAPPAAGTEPADLLLQWEMAMRSRDAEVQASFYAVPAERYLHRLNASKEQIQADKQDEINRRRGAWDVKLEQVKIDQLSETTAAATLVKHYSETQADGVVREWFVPSEMKLKKVYGLWWISSERDLDPAMPAKF